MALFLAGLRGIDDAIIKAAQVDGASLPRIYWRIVIPSLRPVFFSADHHPVAHRHQELRPGGGPHPRRPGLCLGSARHLHVRLRLQRRRLAFGAASAMMMLFMVMAIIVPYLYSELRKKAAWLTAASCPQGPNAGQVSSRAGCSSTVLLLLFALYFLPPSSWSSPRSRSMAEIRTGNLDFLPRQITFDAWIKAWNSRLHRRYQLRGHEGLFLELRRAWSPVPGGDSSPPSSAPSTATCFPSGASRAATPFSPCCSSAASSPFR
jgi:hypothetical protein